jgi:hypothetical protein
MRDEKHRKLCIEAFDNYCNGHLTVNNYKISDYTPLEKLPVPEWDRCVYILRVGSKIDRCPSISGIPNRNDPLDILYIGGHESGKRTARFNALLRSCYTAEELFRQTGKAENDKAHGHPVAGCLTTSLLSSGFQINCCQIDLVKGEPNLDELELLIGYQERYHHLPPWNAIRGGASAYVSGG